MEHNQHSHGNVVLENTPKPLAEGLVEEMPEVEYAATAAWTEN